VTLFDVDKWTTQSQKSEGIENKLSFGVTRFPSQSSRQRPSSPSLNYNSRIWKGRVVDLHLPPKLRTIPCSKTLDDMGSDPALLDALAMASCKPAVQLVHFFIPFLHSIQYQIYLTWIQMVQNSID